MTNFVSEVDLESQMDYFSHDEESAPQNLGNFLAYIVVVADI